MEIDFINLPTLEGGTKSNKTEFNELNVKIFNTDLDHHSHKGRDLAFLMLV